MNQLTILLGEKKAIKIIDKKKYWNKNMEQLEREIEIVKQIKHENIISVFDIYSTQKFLYIVLELLIIYNKIKY